MCIMKALSNAYGGAGGPYVLVILRHFGPAPRYPPPGFGPNMVEQDQTRKLPSAYIAKRLENSLVRPMLAFFAMLGKSREWGYEGARRRSTPRPSPSRPPCPSHPPACLRHANLEGVGEFHKTRVLAQIPICCGPNPGTDPPHAVALAQAGLAQLTQHRQHPYKSSWLFIAEQCYEYVYQSTLVWELFEDDVATVRCDSNPGTSLRRKPGHRFNPWFCVGSGRNAKTKLTPITNLKNNGSRWFRGSKRNE